MLQPFGQAFGFEDVVVVAGQDGCFFRNCRCRWVGNGSRGVGRRLGDLRRWGGGYTLGSMGAHGGRLGLWMVEGKVLSYSVERVGSFSVGEPPP